MTEEEKKSADLREKMGLVTRSVETAIQGDEDTLGPLCNLPGRWANEQGFEGRGWNLIALPFGSPEGGGLNYRLLMNQYDEELRFTTVDTKVPNRGIREGEEGAAVADQLLVALDYEQRVDQVASEDFPESGLAGAPGATIHHEPGLWLHMKNEQTDGIDIGRMATVPHGDSVLALGRSEVTEDPVIPRGVSALPIGVPPDLESPYLAPYKHFEENPFKGTVSGRDFPGFLPTDTSQLLKEGLKGLAGRIQKTHVLEVDSEIESGGVLNIPFIVKQANASSMKSTFWIHELDDGFVLQYLQVVMLDFFSRGDGMPGSIRWPHISINTMIRTGDADSGAEVST